MEREEEKAKLLLPLRPLYEGEEGGKDGDRFVRVATPKKLSSTLARTLNGIRKMLALKSYFAVLRGREGARASINTQAWALALQEAAGVDEYACYLYETAGSTAA